MEDLFKIEIKSVDGVLLEESVSYLRVNTSSGDMGIYSGHTFTISDVLEGVLEYQVNEDNSKLVYISDGVVVVKPDHVLVTVDYLKYAADFDKKDLSNTIKESRKQYKEASDYTDKMKFLNTLNISENKLKVASSI